MSEIDVHDRRYYGGRIEMEYLGHPLTHYLTQGTTEKHMFETILPKDWSLTREMPNPDETTYKRVLHYYVPRYNNNLGWTWDKVKTV